MSLPKSFIDHLKNDQGLSQDEVNSFLIKPHKSIRRHPSHIIAEELEKIPYCSTGYNLISHPRFMYDLRWHGGHYYVQNASSMLLELAYNHMSEINRPKWILDLCAAPGGKTTHLCSLIGGDGMIVANEVDGKRVQVLKENLQRWGMGNHIVTQSPTSKIQSPILFDMILVDAPCSGEGLFAEYPKACENWSWDYTLKCASVQRQILQDAHRLLAPGGFLLYSTCTANHNENKSVVQDLEESHGYKVIDIPDASAYTTPMGNRHYGYQSYPHHNNGRAFFFSLLQKPDDKTKSNSRPNKVKSKLPTVSDTPFYTPQPRQTILKTQHGHHCIPSDYIEHVHGILNANKVLDVGITICDERMLKPSPSLAFSELSYGQSYPLGMDSALKFLKGETLTSKDRGWQIVDYNGIRLGWVKSVPGRANNHHPKAWRLPPSTQIDDLADFHLN